MKSFKQTSYVALLILFLLSYTFAFLPNNFHQCFATTAEDGSQPLIDNTHDSLITSAVETVTGELSENRDYNKGKQSCLPLLYSSGLQFNDANFLCNYYYYTHSLLLYCAILVFNL